MKITKDELKDIIRECIEEQNTIEESTSSANTKIKLENYFSKYHTKIEKLVEKTKGKYSLTDDELYLSIKIKPGKSMGKLSYEDNMSGIIQLFKGKIKNNSKMDNVVGYLADELGKIFSSDISKNIVSDASINSTNSTGNFTGYIALSLN